MNQLVLIKSSQAMVAAILATALVCLSYFMFEPVLGHAQLNDEFTVTQQITAELAITASTTDVSMVPTIPSLSGGISYGTTSLTVKTNNNTGYNITMYFASDTAMYRDGGGGQIENYVATSTADYNFDSAQLYGQFGYTVNADTAADASLTFRDNGTDTCGVGTSNTFGKCWLAPTSSVANATELIDRTSATPVGGATTTIVFQVDVPANPNPNIPTGFYTATATLTVAVNL